MHDFHLLPVAVVISLLLNSGALTASDPTWKELSIHAQSQPASNDLFNRALSAMEAHDYDRAVADLNNFVRANPNDAEAYYTLALVYGKQGKQLLAIDNYTIAISRNRTAPASFANRAAMYVQLGEWQKAICDCNEAVKRDPKNPTPYVTRGSAYFGLKDYPRAIAEYTKATSLGERSPAVYLARGRAYEKKGDTRKAYNDFKLAAEVAVHSDPTQ